MKNHIPLWLTIVAGFLSLLGLFVGFALYISPETFIRDIDFATMDIKYLTNMWAARQISISVIIGISLIKESSGMLKASLIAYCLMNLQDIFIGIARADSGLAFGSSVFFGISAFLLVTLIKKNKYSK